MELYQRRFYRTEIKETRTPKLFRIGDSQLFLDRTATTENRRKATVPRTNPIV